MEGLAEALDVVAWWLQPRWPVRPAAGLLGFGEWDAGGDGDGGGEVSQVVDGDAGNAGFVGRFPEPVEYALRAEWSAVGSAEHEWT
ncbi:hypothetical protein OHB36_20535 [Streptomyces sp. NBC_00320]|uniref:hypothetical protein n=1 Tax=unclassified Streptomyces TaxID=2593676 RepID=UPI00224D1DC2|nr:hypothetical protein [Streptomyces sp. NBC_00320]MCX5149131.1 hypothetical protein [Streptomyces sp. NBC_00320]